MFCYFLLLTGRFAWQKWKYVIKFGVNGEKKYVLRETNAIFDNKQSYHQIISNLTNNDTLGYSITALSSGGESLYSSMFDGHLLPTNTNGYLL